MGKETTAKPKMADVRKPKKSSAPATPEPLVIQPRPVIGRAISVTAPLYEAGEDQPITPATTSTAPLKRPVIVPPTGASAAPQAGSQHPENVESTIASEPALKPVAEPKPVEPTSQPESQPEPLPPQSATDQPPVADIQTQSPVQPTPETLKAVEEATKAKKHAETLEKYINERQFFVPINAVARKRSIKVSFILTFVLFLLGIVLIDLMLDSGLIYLIQHVPHTNFFGD